MRRTGAAVTAAILLLAGGTPAQAHREHVPSVSVWVTTPDRAETLHQRAPVSFERGDSALTTITVDPGTRYQRMDGFGASLTDSAAAVLYRLTPAQRDAALRSLFDPREGIGVSFLRQPVGSSDFTAATQHYSYDDVPAGQTDFALRHFSIAHDQAQILPLLRRAKQLNPRLSIMGTPWSAPAWMKTSDSLIGGHLKDDPKIYDAYARYLVKYVQAYARAGVPIDFLTVQNEPQNRHDGGYPGTALPVPQEAKVIEALGPLLKKASPRTKILGYDHNWTTHPGDVATTPPGEDPETDYPYRLLDSPAGKWLAGTAYHCYSGDPSAQTALHNAYPAKGIWFTECSGSHGATDTPEQVFRGTLTWHARTLAIGTTRNWAKSVVNWNIALDSTGGPHLGGCDTCTGLLTLQADGSVTRDAEYYTIGHLSKFVKPGAVRIASTSYGTTGWNGQLMDVAFRNPDGSTALIVHNENDEPRSFAVAVGSRRFEYTLPGGALATYTWNASLSGPSAIALTSSDPVLDGDGSTRWSSGAAQTPGQSFTADLGRMVRFSRVALDSGDNLGDYARSFDLAASSDGQHWRSLGSFTGRGQLTTVSFRDTRARYLKVTNTGSSSNWWSVADLRLFR
ncbi:glycoside hydrolase family 30 beta sandwich domain-containing protein [Actinoplanes sp. TFC3]|uniref:glycoside hydrolase family 30 beta sandwich domain-containing protein n=1 Tax=Actinoplanes sp. TFC3 TaxID=1710355 RepID=UPI0008317ADF|nr:glycoside hydrolase family 30 beta sandwich domain-containing protein [Actinoplanes sp. TFC3]